MVTDDEQELDELIAEFLTALERGDQPDPLDWMVRNPGHAAEFAVFLQDLSRLEGAQLDTSLSGSLRGAIELSRASGAAGDVGAEVVDFGDYELVGAPLGVGGMGVVYRARLKGTRVEVALKRLRSSSGGAVSRIAEEIEAAALLRHPHIVPVYHAGEYRGERYFTMALIEGGPLGQFLGELRRDQRFAAELVAKVSRAVHFAHQRRILHRDLKPSNILLDEQWEPHVADFGLAERLTESGSAEPAERLCGSLPWMPPEVLQEEAGESAPAFSRRPVVTTAVDVWALGVILYEVLTGERPFRGETPQQVRDAILRQSPRHPRDVDAAIPRDLEAVCLRCLEKSPAHRYESASAVALDLERWLRDEPVRARQASSGERLLRWCRRAPGLAAFLVTGAMLLLALTVGLVQLVPWLRQEVIAQMTSICEHQAQHVAGNVAERLEALKNTVGLTAERLSRRSLLSDNAGPSWSRDEVPEWLKQSICRLATTIVEPVREPPFHGAFLLDDRGKLVFHSEEGNPVKDGPYTHRDYFKVVSKQNVTIDNNYNVYVSHAYHSDLDNTDKVALATKLRFEGSEREYVLAVTLRTARRLQLDVAEMSNSDILAILTAPLEETGREGSSDKSTQVTGDVPSAAARVHGILMHPGMTDDASTMLFPKNSDGSPAIVLSETTDVTQLNYRDPLAAVDPRYAGEWVLAFSRVPGTDLYVGIQASVDKAIAPFYGLMRRIGSLLLAVLSTGLLVFGGALRLRHRGPGQLERAR